MISRARLLMHSASFDEVGSFALMSMFVVILLATGGYGVLEAVPELVGSSAGLTGTYLSELADALFPAVIVMVAVGFAVLNYQKLQNTVARCELAEDELAWIKNHSEYERMVEDRELMRLAANVRRVCRAYPATHGLFVKFLEEYRALLKNHGSGTEKTRQARIQHMNEAADEGLERHQRRVQREQRRKEQEKS